MKLVVFVCLVTGYYYLLIYHIDKLRSHLQTLDYKNFQISQFIELYRLHIVL